MSSDTRPSAIQCAELAAQRAATDVKGRLQRRVSSLATITVIAPLLGVFDAIRGIANSFQSVCGSKSSAIAAIEYRLSLAMLPIIFGLFAAIMASWFYQALRAQLEIFDVEMKGAVVVAVEAAVAHLRRLRAAEPILWARLSKGPSSGPSVATLPIDGPRLRFIEKCRHGVRQLLWPKLEAQEDASAVLEAAGWSGVVYGAVACLIAWMQHLWLTGILLFTFFEFARRLLQRHSWWGLISIVSFVLVELAVKVRDYGWSDGATFLLVALLPFTGSFKAMWALSPRSLLLRHFMLACLALLVSVPIWTGQPLEMYLFAP